MVAPSGSKACRWVGVGKERGRTRQRCRCQRAGCFGSGSPGGPAGRRSCAPAGRWWWVAEAGLSVGWLEHAVPAPGRPPVRDLRRGGDELPLGLPQRGLTGDRTQPSLVAKSPGSDQSGPWWPPGFSQRGGRHHAVLGPGKNDPHIREAGTAATEREGCFSPWMGAGTRSTLHGCVARRCSTCRRWMTWGSSTTTTERSGRSWSSAAMIPSL